MGLLFWAVVCLVGFVGAAWCLFAAVMTAALGTGPVTPEQLANLRSSANWLLAGSVAFAGSAVLAVVRLVMRSRQGPRRESVSQDDAVRSSK